MTVWASDLCGFKVFLLYFIENEEVMCEYRARDHLAYVQIAFEIPLFHGRNTCMDS
jgi:hypothetical protein